MVVVGGCEKEYGEVLFSGNGVSVMQESSRDMIQHCAYS